MVRNEDAVQCVQLFGSKAPLTMLSASKDFVVEVMKKNGR